MLDAASCNKYRIDPRPRHKLNSPFLLSIRFLLRFLYHEYRYTTFEESFPFSSFCSSGRLILLQQSFEISKIFIHNSSSWIHIPNGITEAHSSFIRWTSDDMYKIKKKRKKILEKSSIYFWTEIFRYERIFGSSFK